MSELPKQKMCLSKLVLAIFLLAFSLPDISTAQSSPQDYLAVHNAARAEVGVGPLTWNRTVAAYAQRYANHRAQDCALQHSQGPYGENIAEGYGNMNGADAVKFWLTEEPNYDYHSNSCVHDECLHYTQIIWRDSVQLGCARAKCYNGWMFVTCNYYPPGNYEGERPY